MEAGSGAEGWGGVLQAVFTAPHMPLPVGVAGGRAAGPKRGPSPEAGSESWRCSLALVTVTEFLALPGPLPQ